MTNIFNVSSKTTKLSTLLFSAAFSIIAASADASRNLKEEDTQYTSPRGKNYLKTDKKVSLRSGSKSAWQSEGVSRKRKASALSSAKSIDTGTHDDVSLTPPPAKKICIEETRDQDDTSSFTAPVTLSVTPVSLTEAILTADEDLEMPAPSNQHLEGSYNATRFVPVESMEVVFDEQTTSSFQATPTHGAEGYVASEPTPAIYDFGVDSLTKTAKSTFRKYATKRNFKIAGGVAGVVGGLALADYLFTGGVATTTVASLAPSIAQNVTSVAYNASSMCPVPSFMPTFSQTVLPEVVSQASTLAPSFTQSVVPSFVNTTVTPSFGPLLSGYVGPVVETMTTEIVSTASVPYVAPYTPSFLSPVVETLAPIVTNNASFAFSFAPTFAQTGAPEATRSIFWGFSNVIFGPNH